MKHFCLQISFYFQPSKQKQLHRILFQYFSKNIFFEKVQILLKEDSFAYAHLVKFERPIKTDSGKSARRAKDYVYITDGSSDIIFNDGSSDIRGNANGSQTYIANKLVKVGDVSETTEAKSSNMNIQLLI